jgi:hypothetical protein
LHDRSWGVHQDWRVASANLWQTTFVIVLSGNVHGRPHRHHAQRKVGRRASEAKGAPQPNGSATVYRFLNLRNVDRRIIRSDEDGWTLKRFDAGTNRTECKHN